MSQDVLDDLGFTYDIVRSKRKSAAIHVKANTVQVRIPYFVDDAWALDFLCNKAPWVRRKLAQQQQQSQLIPQIKDGSQILWLGQTMTLSFVPAHKGIHLEGEKIRLGCNKAEQAIAELQQFFKQQARVYMITRTQLLAEKFGLDHLLQQVRFRRTKSKWGHCTSQGVIQYNWLIMGAPVSVIDYLICHELSHLIHPNHSKAFWQHVETMCPDYKTQQAWLKQNSVALSWC
ncbi:SprT family zinc-dependent metalloprotease [Oceaniserpentilla sp. 4NH20-0058]|uniref:M48 family metallopeptidase n=1 Tax=Oceaniserpentilla sp. 4NH20-0058 TaxID=3127660 RepID=UPI003104EFC2